MSLNEFLEDHVAKKRLVVLGEYHGSPQIVNLQLKMQDTMAKSLVGAASSSNFGNHKIVNNAASTTTQCEEKLQQQDEGPKLRVVMEHFSMEMQGILDKYHEGKLTTPGLVSLYKEIGTEGHNLIPYIPALESAQSNPSIHLYGGFIPRPYARLLMREGTDIAIKAASEAGFLSGDERLVGSDAHYDFFESLLTGRRYMDLLSPPTDQYRKMFPAQLIKDASMAYCAKSLQLLNVTGKDRFLLVCGVGHMLYNHGVPERILSNESVDKGEMLRIACLPLSELDDGKKKVDNDPVALLKDVYGDPELDAGKQ